MWSYKLLQAWRNFRGSVASAKLNKLDGGAQPCPLRSRNSGNVPVKFNNLSVIAIALIKKSAGQVKHRNKAEEGEGAIVFGTSDNWKKKPKKNRKCAKSRIVFVTKKVEP
ncbi:hypothetical protein PC114_g16859 [Phytophthora cactorum]|nr:hypothetical protein PC114_g16859 [Phytophthora cactorum]